MLVTHKIAGPVVTIFTDIKQTKGQVFLKYGQEGNFFESPKGKMIPSVHACKISDNPI